MVQQRKLKSRSADGIIYFVRREIEELIDRQIKELQAPRD